MSSEAVAGWLTASLALLALLGGFAMWMAKMYHLVSSTHEQLPKLWRKVDATSSTVARIDRRVIRIEERLDIDETDLDDDP